jgi:transcriptional regulator with AAA-type ATPase domain
MGTRGQDTTMPDTVLEGRSDGKRTLAIHWVFPTEGTLTRLQPGSTIFGRDADCTVPLVSASVSRRHAEIRWTPGGTPLLLDLNSTNHVFVNGQEVKHANLKLGDVLRLGDRVGIVVAPTGEGSEPWSFRELTPGYWGGPGLQAALGPARLVATTDLPIIIQGATGSGKEGAARAIHAWSGRSGPFVAINCAALPETLAEAELFGYRKGAFTGADRASPGYLRAAEGGTLFLDEICELSLPIQAKLLRAVEQRELTPLGESTPVALDVRLLAATQAPLRQAVNERRFRGDLLARLDGLTVALPSLRDRPDEIPALFRKIVELQGEGGAPPRLDPTFVEGLCTYEWPFNVRELVLLARKLIALHPDGGVLDQRALGDRTRADGDRKRAESLPVHPIPKTADLPAPDEQTLLAALRAQNGNVKQAAEALGISRGRAYRMMEKIDSIDLAALRRGDTPDTSDTPD